MSNSALTDERALILLNEFAKYDKEALRLMVLLQDAKDFGDRDQLICKVHYYIREHSKHD